MIGGKHIQSETHRHLHYRAFYRLARETVYIEAAIFEGERLLAMPELNVIYVSAHGSIEDVVTARLVRYLNDTAFGVGNGPDPAWINSPVHLGPWR